MGGPGGPIDYSLSFKGYIHMNLKLSVKAAVATALVGAVPAVSLAQVGPGSSTGSSLLVEVFDPATHVGLIEYLSNTVLSFSPGGTDGATSNAGLSFSVQLDGSVSAFENLFNATTNSNLPSTPVSLTWDVIGMTVPIAQPPYDTVLTTGLANGASGNRNNGSIQTAGGQFNTQFADLYPACTTNPCIANGGSADVATNFLKTVAPLASTSGSVANNGSATPGTALGFYEFLATAASGLTNSTKTAYSNTANSTTNYATWTLNGQGQLVYSIAGQSTVPLPAAAWLFGSGLLGLLGIGRRRLART